MIDQHDKPFKKDDKGRFLSDDDLQKLGEVDLFDGIEELAEREQAKIEINELRPVFEHALSDLQSAFPGQLWNSEDYGVFFNTTDLIITVSFSLRLDQYNPDEVKNKLKKVANDNKDAENNIIVSYEIEKDDPADESNPMMDINVKIYKS